MTTPPKAKKFRIRRPGSDAPREASPEAQPTAQGAQQAPRAQAQTLRPAGQQPQRPATPQGQRPPQGGQPQPRQPRQLNAMEEAALSPQEDGFGGAPFPGSAAADRGGQAAPTPSRREPPEVEIGRIKQEGLTGRQLRMARRVAQKHGLPATSDYDAVRLLRKAGIDPFQTANMLQLVSSEEGGAKPQPPEGGARVQLPQTIQPQQQQLPSTQVMDAADRAKSIQEMQNQIVRRRRKKLLLLATRLAALVLLPTLIAGWYFYVVATPMYATKSEFVIQKAESGGTAMSSLFAGSGLATSQDSITVQSYLSSRDAMLRLDEELGFKAHFSNPEIDPIQRLDADASNEEAYKTYTRNVKIGFDPTEGIVKMEVIAADPAFSRQMSEALIRYAEQRVDNLTSRLRDDQMAGARESYEEAEQAMLDAQAEVLRLQESMGIFDATSDATSIMGQVNTFETQLQQKRLQLQQLLDNPRPNQARVEGVRGDIARLEQLVADLRARLTEDGQQGGDSLASVSGQLTIAQTNLQTRTALMQQALQQLETARIEANKQTRYLEMGVHPVAPDRATYPRAFENTLLAFLVFAGIYLMISITAAILREQVTS
ncbi:MAG: capsule biosynthesis protein [Maritimibacter sp.]|uniref:capsule biosynthesis protein n=1 Tax=Maritimibacter sp. TaxID=2003363 RepID=UPI001E150815|nr:capsule biosynthesis protein [Maritimibacter sp.]MBL6426796.1 capsule biosynthesis protein [Maritimibacter sp.]